MPTNLDSELRHCWRSWKKWVQILTWFLILQNTECTVSTNIYIFWRLSGLYFLSRSWLTKSAAPFSFPLIKEVKKKKKNNFECYLWLGLGVIVAMCEILHINYIKIPEDCWFLQARTRKQGWEQTQHLPKRVTVNPKILSAGFGLEASKGQRH